MYVKNVKMIGSWIDVLNAARATTGKKETKVEPSDHWKLKILKAEHSPIRLISFTWQWFDLPSCVSVHFVRHKIGIEHFVCSQRSDRTGIDRNKLPQDAPVSHMCTANVQALINISRRRLCQKAAPETLKAWRAVIDKISKIDPIIAAALIPDCEYRGKCHEFDSCGRMMQYDGII